MHKKITLKRIMAAVESGEYLGFCLACGGENDGIEPDARDYECQLCDAHRVYGAEEILFMIAA
jgi:hypothetical protein